MSRSLRAISEDYVFLAIRMHFASMSCGLAYARTGIYSHD